MSTHADALREVDGHLAAAAEHLRAGRHESAAWHVGRARGVVARALEGNGVDPIANPTGATGTQTSNGQSPRAFTPEQIRQRDQLRGCQMGYEARMQGRLR